MIRQRKSKHRQLATLFLTLALFATPLLAQPDTANTPAPAASEASTDKPAATPTPKANSAPAPKSSGASSNSPFDYRSSEEISEDVPVSFPVDI